MRRLLPAQRPAAVGTWGLPLSGIEILGYAASALIALSMLMRSLVRLRLVNLAGGLAMLAYGIAIVAWPVVLVNLITVSINVVHLTWLLREPSFRLLSVELGQSAYVGEFLRFYGDDIARFHPAFDLDAIAAPEGFFILRDMVPAGIMVYEANDDGAMWVHLDYVAPPYRDLKNARYAYDQQAPALMDRGFDHWRTGGSHMTPVHRRYMAKIGFSADPTRPAELIRPIKKTGRSAEA